MGDNTNENGGIIVHENLDDNKSKIEQLAQYIRESKRIVAFTGAGCSTESGVPDFRGSKGLFNEGKKGTNLYISTDKHDYRKDVTALQQTFQSKRSLLKEPSNPSGTLVATSLPDNQGHFSYFVGDLVDSSEQEEELLVKELPVGTYAQINVDFKDPSGLTLAVAKAKNYFFNKWLPDSGYEVLPGIESYELYDRRSRIKLASMLLIFPLRKK